MQTIHKGQKLPAINTIKYSKSHCVQGYVLEVYCEWQNCNAQVKTSWGKVGFRKQRHKKHTV
jgi:hypothetical protein